MKLSYSVKDLLAALTVPFTVKGSLDRNVVGPAALNSAESDSITFCNKKGAAAVEMINNTAAGVVLCPSEQESKINVNDQKTLIFVENPRLAFIEIIRSPRNINQFVVNNPKIIQNK